jgi:hypothetical protein
MRAVAREGAPTRKIVERDDDRQDSLRDSPRERSELDVGGSDSSWEIDFPDDHLR